MFFKATPCPCGYDVCKDWHVEPVAAVQGVRFTEEQAKKVARFLNETQHKPRTTRT